MAFFRHFRKDYWLKFWRLCSKKEKKIIFISSFFFLSAVIFLIGAFYLSHTRVEPAYGGRLVEGVVGKVSTLNPILAGFNDADGSLISLIYDGILAPDGKGGYKPDLAESCQPLNGGSAWRVVLKDNIFWQDGKRITTDDIVFTIEKILDPRTRSPLAPSWQGVVVKAYDKRIIEFYLKEPYQFFRRNLADLKIIPKHIWESVPVSNYWLTDYNLLPVGSGPFEPESYQRTVEGTIKSFTLKANKKYFEGSPYLEGITFKYYDTYEEAARALANGKINSLADVALLGEEKTFLAKKVKKIEMPRFYGVFFNNQGEEIFKDGAVREALALATPKEQILKEVLNGEGKIINTPFIKGMDGWNPKFQEDYFDVEKAESVLEKAGFVDNDKDGIREKKEKDGKEEKLEFNLLFPSSPLLFRVGNILKESWAKIGVKVNLVSKPIDRLKEENIFPRDYQALLIGETTSFHPDLFGFWHSSQKFDPGLNIALFDNGEVDKLLEEIRSSGDKKKREEDYFAFQKIFLSENPAVFLFSPDYIWLLPSSLKGLGYLEKIDYSFERFIGARRWYMKEIRE